METPLDCTEMQVWGIVESHKTSNAYALILQETDGTRHLPVIVGKAEAQYILIAKKNISTPRPLTHDLFLKLLRTIGWSLEYVEIYKEEDGVFYAYLVLRQGQEEAALYHMDARTSDALSIALKAHRAVYVNNAVLQRLGVSKQDIEQGGLDEVFRRGLSSEETLEELEKKMEEAVRSEDYELAARLRDRINQLKQSSPDPSATPSRP